MAKREDEAAISVPSDLRTHRPNAGCGVRSDADSNKPTPEGCLGGNRGTANPSRVLGAMKEIVPAPLCVVTIPRLFTLSLYLLEMRTEGFVGDIICRLEFALKKKLR